MNKNKCVMLPDLQSAKKIPVRPISLLQSNKNPTRYLALSAKNEQEI